MVQQVFFKTFNNMNDQNNTIVNGSSRRTIQSNSTSTPNAHSRQGKKPMNQESLKMALAALAGAGVGSGAMWAGTQAASDGMVVDPVVPTPDEEQTAQPTVAQPEETPVTAADVDASAAQHTDDSQQEKHAQGDSGTNKGGGSSSDHHHHRPHPTPKPDPDPVKPEPDPTPRPVPVHHTYEIGEVEEVTDDEGNTMRFARGKMDEHEAVFRLDNDNRVLGAVVDLNDNGEYESNEFVDLRQENITAVVHIPNPEPEVRVISVENDVNLNGHLVNVARVAVGDDHALLVDADRDDEVDYLVHDDNGDGEIDESEVHDISERHMPMPTADDVENSGAELAQNDGLPDYSNDSDITNYYA